MTGAAVALPVRDHPAGGPPATGRRPLPRPSVLAVAAFATVGIADVVHGLTDTLRTGRCWRPWVCLRSCRVWARLSGAGTVAAASTAGRAPAAGPGHRRHG